MLTFLQRTKIKPQLNAQQNDFQWEPRCFSAKFVMFIGFKFSQDLGGNGTKFTYARQWANKCISYLKIMTYSIDKTVIFFFLSFFKRCHNTRTVNEFFIKDILAHKTFQILQHEYFTDTRFRLSIKWEETRVSWYSEGLRWEAKNNWPDEHSHGKKKSTYLWQCL